MTCVECDRLGCPTEGMTTVCGACHGIVCAGHVPLHGMTCSEKQNEQDDDDDQGGCAADVHAEQATPASGGRRAGPLPPEEIAAIRPYRSHVWTINVHHNLRPRPWWALRWRPWWATLIHGITYVGYPVLVWRAKTRDELVAKVSKKIPRMAQGFGQATWLIEVDEDRVEG